MTTRHTAVRMGAGLAVLPVLAMGWAVAEAHSFVVREQQAMASLLVEELGENPNDKAGALMVQSQGFADVNMGLGILINGLAALMIGEAIVGKQSVARQLAAPFVGAIVYYQLVSFCLAAGMPPPDLKLATGLFVLAMLALPSLKRSRGPAPARETVRE